MEYNFNQIINRRSSGSIKWDKYGPDVLPLWVADMDFVSPEPVIRALQERISHGIFGYPGEIPGLRQAVIDHASEAWGWEINPEHLLIQTGVVTGFNQACHAFAGPQGGVLVQTPVYPPIWHAAKTTGCRAQEMQLYQDGAGVYQFDRTTFGEAIDDSTRLFILCNPHNPVGRVFRQAELEGMAEICLRKGVMICSDEIHADLIYPGSRHIPIASLDKEIAQHSITLFSPSKTYNIAGLQCSVAVIPNQELRQRYRVSQQGLTSWTNLLGLVAARAAYAEGQEWLEQLLVYLGANRKFLHEYVAAELPGISVTAPQGTYLSWLDCRQAFTRAGAEQQNPYRFFLKHAGVALSDGADFGPGGEGFVRFNFGCPRSLLAEALERMKKALLEVLPLGLS